MTSPLRDLTSPELRVLSEALQNGRLRAPFTPEALSLYGLRGNLASIANELQWMATEGATGTLLARFLANLIEARSHVPELEESVDLVWTGPEAPGVPSRDTGVVVRELFSTAEQSVLVAGYAVYQGRTVFESLAARMEHVPSLDVRMYLDVGRKYKDTTIDSDIVHRFVAKFRREDWPGTRFPRVFYDPRSLDMDCKKKTSLHAKCVVIDRRVAFVSSANFTEAAQVRNIEVGVLIRSPRFASRLVDHFEGLAEAGALKPLPGL